MRERRTSGWLPVLTVVVAAFLALAVLPSALNLPQPNPATTLEYAPVPASDDAAPPPGGNLGSLGLGRSSTLASAGLDAGAGPARAAGGTGARPMTKRCVGNPPRQTEDPLAPPCVGFFDGDNFGATHQGVSREEVRILIQDDQRAWCGSSRGCETAPTDTYVDLAVPPKPNEDEYIYTRHLRHWQRYFNERYQTYNRFAHFFIHYGKSTANTNAEVRRAQVQDHWTRIRPFAVVPALNAGHTEPYIEGMAQKRVLVFTSALFRSEAFYNQSPGFIWGFQPSLEKHAATYSSYVCSKVVPYPVSFSGNPGENSRGRRYGLLYTTDPAFPELRTFKDLVRRQVEACGVRFDAEGTFPLHRYGVSTRTEYAAGVMADFRQRGITTILWPGGLETSFSKAAAGIAYRPEWVVAGDGWHDGALSSQVQDQSVWRHAWTTTAAPRLGMNQVSAPCKNAYTEVDPDVPQDTLDLAGACLWYNALRQLFTGIQVAGPRLNSGNIDRGYHAIPAVASTDPSVPACFYEPGDYTCVKDAAAQWWDPQGSDTDTRQAGCWRMPEHGRRYLRGAWPAGDVPAQRSQSDPCNGYLGGLFTYFGT